MPTPTIIRGSDNFFCTTYEGNGGGQKVGKFVPFTDSGTINKSCIFDKTSRDALIRTPSADGSTAVFTISLWYKPTTSNYGILLYASASDDAWNSASSAGLFMEDFKLRFYSSGTQIFTTNRTFKDTSKFYHILVANDSGESGDDKIKLYVDGDLITSFSPDNREDIPDNSIINTQIKHNIGGQTTTSTVNGFINANIAEFNFIDGQALTPSTFGLTDTSTGRWIPKTLSGITYGTNGYRLEFANTAGQTVGDDTSGNGNDFTVQNLANTSITIDSPTQNFSTFTTLDATGTSTLTEGNLKVKFVSGTSASATPSTLRIPVGKWYFEYYVAGTNSVLIMMSVAKTDTNFSDRLHRVSGFKTYYPYTRSFYEGNVVLVDDTNMPIGEDDTTIGVYIERKNDGTVNMWAGDDQVSKGTFAFQSSMNPATGANPVGNSFKPSDELKLYIGSDGNGNYSSAQRGTFNFGQLKISPIDGGTVLTDYTSTAGGFFRFQPVGDFKALNQDNFPDEGVEPDFVWIKDRDTAYNHISFDSSQGVNVRLLPSATNSAVTAQDTLNKFLKGGFQTGSNITMNNSGDSFVSWNWVANGGTTSANANGSGASLASNIQANVDAGFSIVTYAGSSSGAKTVAHGLSQTPEMIIYKNRTDSRNWFVYDKFSAYASMVPYSSNPDYYLLLNSNAARDTGNVFNNSAPTDKIFHVQDAASLNTNGSGKDYVAYCFHSVPGFSKIGHYRGNGVANGTFVHLGFKPAWVLIKALSPGSTNWIMYDNRRDPINPMYHRLYANLTNSQGTSGEDIDFLSNGFKNRRNDGDHNNSNRNYIFLAFAEYPFEGDGTSPVTAR